MACVLEVLLTHTPWSEESRKHSLEPRWLDSVGQESCQAMSFTWGNKNCSDKGVLSPQSNYSVCFTFWVTLLISLIHIRHSAVHEYSCGAELWGRVWASVRSKFIIFYFLFSVLAGKAKCPSNPKVSVSEKRKRPIIAIPSLSTYVSY